MPRQADGQVRRPITRGARAPPTEELPCPALHSVPAVVAPAGIAADGLPVGIQIVGPYLHDRTVTAFAMAGLTGGFTPPPAYLAAPA